MELGISRYSVQVVSEQGTHRETVEKGEFIYVENWHDSSLENRTKVSSYGRSKSLIIVHVRLPRCCLRLVVLFFVGHRQSSSVSWLVYLRPSRTRALSSSRSLHPARLSFFLSFVHVITQVHSAPTLSFVLTRLLEQIASLFDDELSRLSVEK